MVLQWTTIFATDTFHHLTHYQTTNFKLKEFADDNFKFDKNGSKLSKRLENTVGKGEIARYEQFLLFPQCFQKACFTGASKGVIVWEWVKHLFNFAISYSQTLLFGETLWICHTLLDPTALTDVTQIGILQRRFIL